MFFDDNGPSTESIGMNLRQIIAVAWLNLLILGELSLSIYLASQDPANLTGIFLKWFFGMAIPTFIVAKLSIHKLGAKALARKRG